MKFLQILALPCFLASTLMTGTEIPLQRLPRSTPEAEGISAAAILRYVDAVQAKVDTLHSFMLLRHGKVIAEAWWAPYSPAERHALFSLSKSFTSTAVGLAIAEGKLSLSDPILGFFPKQAPANPGENLRSMRVRDLLRMSSGQHGDDVEPFPFGTDQDLVKVFLSKPVAHRPGTHFSYNTPGTYMLSAIVQSVTGQTLLDYLQPRLFQPLGITDPRWETSAQGVSIGGYGLSLRTEDLACFGQLYLQRGQWNGRQLVPAAWVDAATSLQTSTGSNPDSNWDYGYGYQFWRCPHGCYRGDGAFGQLCIVMPAEDAVLVVTAGSREMGPEMDLVWEHLLPAFTTTALPADPASDRLLVERLAHLALPLQNGQIRTPVSGGVAGRRYRFEPNPLQLESLVLEPAKPGSDAVIDCRIGGLDQRIVCGEGRWVMGELIVPDSPPGMGDTMPIATSGAWTADNTYMAQLIHYRTPVRNTLRLRFSGDRLNFDLEPNFSFVRDATIHLVGTARP